MPPTTSHAVVVLLRYPQDLPSNADFVAGWSGKTDGPAAARLRHACSKEAMASAVAAQPFRDFARVVLQQEEMAAVDRLSGGGEGGDGKSSGDGGGCGGGGSGSGGALPSLPMRKATSSDGALTCWVGHHAVRAWRQRALGSDPSASGRWPSAADDDKDGDKDGDRGGSEKTGGGGAGGGSGDVTAELAEQLRALQLQMQQMLELQQAGASPRDAGAGGIPGGGPGGGVGGGVGGGAGGGGDPRAASEPRLGAPKRSSSRAGGSFSQDRGGGAARGSKGATPPPRSNRTTPARRRNEGGGGATSKQGTRIKAL